MRRWPFREYFDSAIFVLPSPELPAADGALQLDVAAVVVAAQLLA